MLQQEICPDCNDLIPAERMDENFVVCTCGYTRSHSRVSAEQKRQKKSSYVIILLSLFLITSFIHTAKWGKEAIVVTPLEVSRVFGTISPQQALRLGDMSVDKKFYIQAQEMYKIYLNTYPEDIAVNEKLGMILFRQKQYKESIPYLEKYFLSGETNESTLFSYGQALTETQDLGEAEEVFLKLIESKPEMYQITVVQALLDLYIEQGRLQDAKKLLSEIVKPGYQIPDHLREQKHFINELIRKKS